MTLGSSLALPFHYKSREEGGLCAFLEGRPMVGGGRSRFYRSVLKCGLDPVIDHYSYEKAKVRLSWDRDYRRSLEIKLVT